MSGRASVLGVLRARAFALVWVSGVVSGFGDKITLIALAYVTWTLTHSALFTSLSVVIATVPNAIFGFFAGALADALGRRRAMVACDLLRVLAIGAIPVAFATDLPLAVVYLLVLLGSVCGAVFKPARLSILPDVLGEGDLGAGNALVVSSDRVVEIVGALIAGLLVAAIGVAAFYVDALTFLVSAALLSRIDVHEKAPSGISPARMLRDAALGVRAIRDSRVLRANTIFSLAAQLAIPVLNALAPVLVFRAFGGGAEEFAAVEAAIAAGAVVTGAAMPALLKRAPKGRLLVAGFGANGVVLLLLAVAPSFEALLALFVLVGVTNVLFLVPNVTIAQEVTPAPFRARVFGARIALLNLTWLPVIVVTGALADVLGPALLIGFAGALTLATAAVGSLLPSIRDVA